MKRILIIAISLVCTLHVAAQVNYSVRGFVPDSLNGKNVYLYACEIKDTRIGSTVVRNGRFSFDGNRQMPVVASVVIDKSNKVFGCVLDAVPVVLNYDGAKYRINGSRRTHAMTEYYNIREEHSRNLKRTNTPSLFQQILSGKKHEFTKEELREQEEATKHNKVVDSIYYQQLDGLLKRNTDNVVGAYVFSYLYDGVGDDEAFQDSILAVAGNEFLATPEVKRMISARNQRIGQTYTDFELPDKDGKKHRLSDYVGAGRYVLVDVWASWCLGCRLETPHVKEAYDKYHGKGFDVVMVSIDGNYDDWMNAMDKDGVKDVGHQLLDKKSIIRKIYGISTIPRSMLIDPTGKIVANDLRGDDLENILSKVLGKQE